MMTSGRPKTGSPLFLNPAFLETVPKFCLAYIAIEELDYPSALVFLDRGLVLEPDHPDLWHEKAFALSRLGQFEEARQSYLKQMDVRPWSSKLNTASAW